MGRREQRRTPGLGWIPINDSRSPRTVQRDQPAFPVIRSDGTVLWENGMDVGVKVAPRRDVLAKARRTI